MSREYRIRIHQPGTLDPSDLTVAFTLGLPQLAAVPVLPSPIVRPTDGRTESVSWTLPAIDVDGVLTEQLGDPSTGRTWLIGRLVQVQLRDDGGPWRTLGTGRLAHISEPDGPGLFTLQVEDERWLERRFTIFGHTQAAQVHPFGLAESFGRGSWHRPAAGFDQMEIVQINGSAVKIRTSGVTPTPREMGVALLGDLVDPGQQSMAPDNSQGNFQSLRLHVTGINGMPADASFPVISLSTSSLGGTATAQRILGTLWPGHSGIPDQPETLLGVSEFWAYWPGANLSTELTARLHTPGKGIAVSDELPLHIGGESGIHLGQLILDILDGVYGGSPLRISAASRATILAADLPRVWLRKTKPENRAEWLENNVYALFLILPLVDPADGIKLLQLWAPEGLDPDTLPLLTASNAAGMVWQNSGHEIRNRIAVTWTALVEDRDGPLIDRLKPMEWQTEEDHDNQDDVGIHELTLATDLVVESGDQPTLTRWLAGEVFAVYGDGPIMREGECDALGLQFEPGDLIRLDCESLQVSNPATQDRTAQRIARVIRATEHPTHYEIQLLDFGPALQPLTPPTIAVEQDTGDPDRWEVTISGLETGETAALEAAWSSSSSQPDDEEWELRDSGLENGTHYVRRRASGGYAHVRAKAVRAGRLPSSWAHASAQLSVRPILERASIRLADRVPIVEGVANAAVAGVRAHFAIHPIGVVPDSLGQTKDFAVAGLSTGQSLGVQVGPGQEITVELEPWTDWTGSAVSGTAGPRIAVTVASTEEPGPPPTPLPPTCTIEPEYYSLGTMLAKVRIHGRDWEGSSSGLQYQYRTYPLDVDDVDDWGEWHSLPSGGAVVTVAIPEKVPLVVEAKVQDGDERESAPVQRLVQPRLPGIDQAGLIDWDQEFGGIDPPASVGGVPIGELVAQGVEPSQNLLPVTTPAEVAVEPSGLREVTEVSLQELGLEVGDPYVISFDVRRTGPGTDVVQPTIYINWIDHDSYELTPDVEGDDWQRVVWPHEVPEDATGLRISVEGEGFPALYDCYFRRWMMHRGTVPIPYDAPPLRPGRGEGYRDIPGHLPPWVRLESAGTPRVLVSGAQEFAAYDEDEGIVLDPPYEDAPLVMVQGPMSVYGPWLKPPEDMEEEEEWEPASQYTIEYAEDVTASGIGRIICKIADISASTSTVASFPAGVLTMEGQRSGPAIIATPANDGRYRVSWGGTLQAIAGPEVFDRADAEIAVAVATRVTGGGWVERAVRTYAATAIGGPGPVQSIHGSAEIAVSQVDEISISIKRLTVSSIGSPGGVAAEVDPGSVNWRIQTMEAVSQTATFPARVIVFGAFGE